MPMNGRESFVPASACCMIGLAMSIGMAKPMPCAVSACVVVTPITRPVSSTSGPPLLPALIAASVWIMPLMARLPPELELPLATVISRPSAETMPELTLLA